MTNLIPRHGTWKSLASAKNDTLVPVLLNETDMERLIGRLLERIVKHGRASSPHGVIGVDGLNRIVQGLSENPKVVGFENEAGRQILEGWLRASVLTMKRSGKGRSGQENIDYFVPHSAAVYRSGYPRTTSRYRKADLFAYEAMLKARAIEEAGDKFDIAKSVMNIIANESSQEERSVLGKGVEFGAFPRTSPHYLEGTSVDIESLLQLRSLEKSVARDPGAEKNSSKLGPFPETSINFGQDLVAFLESCAHLTSLEVTSGLEGILGFHLYCLPLLTSISLDAQFDLASSENEQDGRNFKRKLDLYFDFTNEPDSHSSTLANLSVARDFKRARRLFDNMILLREVESTIRMSKFEQEYASLEKENYEAIVRYQIDALKVDDVKSVGDVRLRMLLSEMGDEERKISQQLIQEIENPIEKIAQIVITDRESEALMGMRKWAYSTGGLDPVARRTANYLLVGTKRASTTWKYRLSDSLLTTLIQLCFIHEGNPLDAHRPTRMPMSMLLKRLEDRYGIIIDRPPHGMDSMEDFKAANLNKAAFKNKLKILGLFDGLSDDSNAQNVRNPLGGTNER